MTRKPLAAIIGKISIRPFCPCPMPDARCLLPIASWPLSLSWTNWTKDSRSGAGYGSGSGSGGQTRPSAHLPSVTLALVMNVFDVWLRARPPIGGIAFGEAVYNMPHLRPSPIESPVILVLITLPHRMTLHTLRREHPVNNVRHSHWKYGLPMLDILTIFLANWAGQAGLTYLAKQLLLAKFNGSFSNID